MIHYSIVYQSCYYIGYLAVFSQFVSKHICKNFIFFNFANGVLYHYPSFRMVLVILFFLKIIHGFSSLCKVVMIFAEDNLFLLLNIQDRIHLQPLFLELQCGSFYIYIIIMSLRPFLYPNL